MRNFVRINYNTIFEEIYTSHFSRMKRFASEYVMCDEDAENIVHDIFMDIWEKKTDFSDYDNPSGFLLVMLKNRCIDFLRHKTVEQHVLNVIQQDNQRELKLKYESLEALNDRLLNEPDIDALIQNAINTLPKKCREIFMQNKFQGKNQKQIAAELQISVNTVESQMAIAYKKLKVALKDFIPILFFYLDMFFSEN